MKFEELLTFLPDYYTHLEIELVSRAYHVAEKAHTGQKRASGEDFLTHCTAVAVILAELKVPPPVIAAALMHDTIEDTDLTKQELIRDFGEEIGNLVDGVTKLTQLNETKKELAASAKAAQAIDDEGKSGTDRVRTSQVNLAQETLRKTFLAMGEDIRVVLIKLADRLHNMRTLGYIPERKRKRIAQQTLDIYAPLASRLGIWQIKWELEDLSFRYINPKKYKDIAKFLDERRSDREKHIEAIVNSLQDLCEQNNLKVRILGRPKHIYSINKKMQDKGIPIEMIRDVRAVRIIVEDVPACYTTLGIIHNKWRPIPGDFDDYIAAPKDNFYQSLHTAVIFDDGKTLEVQIRTEEMDENAEYGIAAHWRYKEGAPRDEIFERRVIWLRHLMEWMQDVTDAGDFIDSMKTDVFSDRVYVFTPKGDIIDLPAGATPLDFAYHVHTEVGHRCRGAKINAKLEPLDYILKTGDQVEIVTAKRGFPSRDWLNPNLRLLNTNRAKSKVKQWFKQLDKDENQRVGKLELEQEFKRLNISDVNLDDISKALKFKTIDEMHLAIGTGDLGIGKILSLITLDEDREEQILEKLQETGRDTITFGDDNISILGLKGLLTVMAKCCKPAPGDEIIGYITRGRGATIHRVDCPNVFRIREKERLVKVSWGEFKRSYPVAVKLKAYDRDGLMKDVSTVISSEGVGMTQAKIYIEKKFAVFDLILEVGDIDQLRRILTVLENLPNVMEARRIKPG
jgi:GTP pyrophosphokinase